VQQIHDALVVLLRRQMYGAGLAGCVLRLWRSSSASRLLETGSEQHPDEEPSNVWSIEHERGLESEEMHFVGRRRTYSFLRGASRRCSARGAIFRTALPRLVLILRGCWRNKFGPCCSLEANAQHLRTDGDSVYGATDASRVSVKKSLYATLRRIVQ
jgi:hypothetical protein